MTPHPTREEQLEAIMGKNLSDHIKEIEAEFEGLFPDSTGRHLYPTQHKVIKDFLTSKIREIATATLAACEVEETFSEYDEGRFALGFHAAISEQKKKANEYLKP